MSGVRDKAAFTLEAAGTTGPNGVPNPASERSRLQALALMKSILPEASRRFATSIESSTVNGPGNSRHSVFRRTPTTNSPPTCERTSSITSMRNRIRLSNDPPYWSVLWL